MREHEVPTHVQAEDRVLLGLTFPPDRGGDRPLRPGLRPLPLRPGGAVRDPHRRGRRLWTRRRGDDRGGRSGAGPCRWSPPTCSGSGLGPRRYAGPPVRARAARASPAARARARPAEPDGRAGAAEYAVGCGQGSGRRGSAATGAPPFRPHRWLGTRRRHGGEERTLKATTRPRKALAVLAAAVLAVATVIPQAALADEHWLDEIDFEAPEPVPGRRLFVEGLTVNGDRAEGRPAGVHRPATDYPGLRRGRRPLPAVLRSGVPSRRGERVDYDVPPLGRRPPRSPSPGEDVLDHAGAFTLEGGEIPPSAAPRPRGICATVQVASLGWTPGGRRGRRHRGVRRDGRGAGLPTDGGGRRGDDGADGCRGRLDHRHADRRGGAGPRRASTSSPTARPGLPCRSPIGEAVHGVTVEAGLEGCALGSPCRRWCGSPTIPSGRSASPRR